jgi:hypothetical protein
MPRIFQWLRRHLSPFPTETLSQTDPAFTQLREANQLLKRTRASRTSGNPVADMVTGTYRRRRRGTQ